MQATDLHELIAWLKTNPNKALAGFSVASQHILSAYFQNFKKKLRLNLPSCHTVARARPYRTWLEGKLICIPRFH